MIYAYIRVSTEMQDLSSQEFEIRNYCAQQRITVDKWISEAVSGTVAIERRSLGRMIRKMKRGDQLICTEISRLGRNMLMIMSILNLCLSRGISIHTIKDRFDLSDNINSKIIAFAFALAAEIERNLISQRTKEALAVKKTQGVKLGRPAGRSKKMLSVCNKMEDIAQMLDDKIPLSTIAKSLGIHRNTLRRYLQTQKINKN